MYYGDLFELWFDQVPGNNQYKPEVLETFRQGGFYRWDFSDQLSLLSINSIFMNYRDQTNDEAEQAQLEWLKKQLSEDNTPDRKFLIQMHIPPGMWYFKWDEQFWKSKSQDIFLDILSRYQDRLSFVLGGHVHSAEIRAPLSSFAVDLKNVTLMMTPGIAPIFNNNPGYTILTFNDQDVT